MRAIVVDRHGGPEVLRVAETEMPRPAGGEVLIRLQAAGVNPVDTYLRAGSQGYDPPLPFIPGMDGCGVVEELGDGSAETLGLAEGMTVYAAGSLTGTYAEYALAGAGGVFPLPDGLDPAEGACLGVPYFTAARALFTVGGAREGEKVLVHGATGGVGTACLQLAAQSGLKAYGTAGSAEGEALIRSLGAEAFSHRNDDRFTALQEVSAGGFDLIVEMLADANLDGDLKMLAPGGRVAVVGSRGRIEITPRDLIGGEGSVRGVRMPLASPEERSGYASLIAEGVAANALRPRVARRLPLTDAAKAHRVVMEEPHLGNLVLEIG